MGFGPSERVHAPALDDMGRLNRRISLKEPLSESPGLMLVKEDDGFPIVGFGGIVLVASSDNDAVIGFVHDYPKISFTASWTVFMSSAQRESCDEM